MMLKKVLVYALTTGGALRFGHQMIVYFTNGTIVDDDSYSSVIKPPHITHTLKRYAVNN